MRGRRRAAATLIGALVAGTCWSTVPAAGASEPAAVPGILRLDDFEDYQWWYQVMGIEAAHRKGADGTGVTVALVDGAPLPGTGELRGQDVRLRTDCYGNSARPPSLAELRNGTQADHGTSMAALIVGSGHGNAPGGAGIAGVAPGARLLAYDAAPTSGLCRGEEVGVLVDQAVEDGADIVSMSLGLDEGVAPAVRRAVEAGVVVVAAMSSKAGGGSSLYPAAVPGVVAVQAVDRDAESWSKTIPRDEAVIAAPGVEVGSGIFNPASDRFDSRGWTIGTSNAAAIVSGVLAGVKSVHPEATGNQLIQHLIHNGGAEDDFDWDGFYGFGIASVTDMLTSSPTQWPDENPLLEGPSRAVKSYPQWVSSEVPDPPGKGENAPQAQASATTDPARTDAGSTDAATTADQQEAGAGAWPWGLGAALAALLAGAAVLARRRTPPSVSAHPAPTGREKGDH